MDQPKIGLSNYKKSLWPLAIEITLIAIVILIPLAFYPHLIRIFISAKELVFEVLVIIGLAFWGFKSLEANINRQEKFKFVPATLNLPIALFMAISILSLIWSDSPSVSLRELPIFLSGPLLYFITANNIYEERRHRRILYSIVIMGSLFGIYGIFQSNGIDFSYWIHAGGRYRVDGVFGNVNYFAEYLIIPLTLAIPLFLTAYNKIKRTLLLIGILSMGTALIFTLTRGCYLGFGSSLIFMFSLFLLSRGKNFIQDNKKIFLLLLIAIIIAAILFAIPNPLSKPGTVISSIKGRVSLSRIVNTFTYGRRGTIAKFAGMMIKDHPLLGSGVGTFKYNTLKYQARFFDQGQNRSLYAYGIADKAHNEYLQLGAELGIAGLAIFIWLMFAYFNYGIRYLKKEKDKEKQGIMIGLMGSIVAVLVDGLFNFPFHLPATIALFWLVIGLSIPLGQNKQQDFNREGEVEEEEEEGEGEGENQLLNDDVKKNFLYKQRPLLYVMIISLSIFLIIFVVRPFIAQTFSYYANKEVNHRNWDRAGKIYQEALKWDSYFGEAYFSIGKILVIKNLYGIAQDYFEKAEKYMDVYFKNGQFDKAAVKAKQAISYQRREKDTFLIYCQLGNTYLHLKEDKLAEEAFLKCLSINANHVNALYGLAVAYIRQNKMDIGLEELQKVIELAPESNEAKYAQDIMEQISQKKIDAPPTETNSP